MEIPITPKELERAHTAAYTGKKVDVLLCDGELTIDSTSAACIAAELPEANGYARFSVPSLAAGVWNETALRYEGPEVLATFTASGAGYGYNKLVVIVDDATYPYSVVDLGPQSLAANARSYPITIVQRSSV
jgi:hypothetical protein